MAATVLQLAVPVAPPAIQSRVDPIERAWTSGSRFGDLRGATLTGIINRAKTGDTADYMDLCEEFLKTTVLGSLYRGRINRVAQAQMVWRAPEDNDNPALAELAAEFVNEQARRVTNMRAAKRWLLHAIGVGLSAVEGVIDRDRIRRVNYVSKFELPHAHRFRYDEAWRPRLYDRGRRSSRGSQYGEQLDSRTWVIHEVRTVAGYPGFQGVMTECLWPATFMKWVDRFRITHQEKYGSPGLHAKVPPTTTQQVREDILADLQDYVSEHVLVTDDNVSVEKIEAALTSDEGYQSFRKDMIELMTLAWLAVTDINNPGTHGSQDAVETRVAALTDPMMADDAEALGETLQQYARGMLALNLHQFPAGTQLHNIPLPECKLATEENEIEAPTTGREQGVDDVVEIDGGGVPQAAAPANDATEPAVAVAEAPTNLASQALNGAQVSSLLEIVNATASGQLSEASAIALMQAAGLVTDPAKARAILAGAQSPPAAEPETADPKAPAPGQPGPSQMTSRTTGRRVSTPRISSSSRSPFGGVRRNG